MKVVFDDDYGYGSSFLEEAFGGLVRIEKFSSTYVLERLIIVSSEKSLSMAIKKYIERAS